MKNIKIYQFLAALVMMALVVTSCEDDKVLPTLSSDSSTYGAPVMENPATKDPIELLPENAGDLFESFKWSKADYGIQVPVGYILEMDSSNSFSAPVELSKTNTLSADITVEDFNDAVLSLGLQAFSESTVVLRTLAVVNGGEVDTISSPVITRTITSYQLSECGDFCTIGLIGSATAGGWDVDTDMRLNDPEKIDKSTWALTTYLIGGSQVKFRAGDNWDANWGSSDFPAGTGTQNGPDITVPTSGYYSIVFNDQSGEYTFTALAGTEYGTIGVIGDATPGGWDSDTDLTQDPGDPHIWTGEVTFADGEAKFRANDAWDANWGAATYPSGYGIGNGPNIPVKAGTYFVWFHDVTGEYAIINTPDSDPFATIGVIGTATAGGWDADTDLVQNPANPYKWSAVMTLNDGEAKFRADDDWTDNWGGSTFPGGVGAKNGPNVVVSSDRYIIQFHSGTGEYYFLK